MAVIFINNCSFALLLVVSVAKVRWLLRRSSLSCENVIRLFALESVAKVQSASATIIISIELVIVRCLLSMGFSHFIFLQSTHFFNNKNSYKGPL